MYSINGLVWCIPYCCCCSPAAPEHQSLYDSCCCYCGCQDDLVQIRPQKGKYEQHSAIMKDTCSAVQVKQSLLLTVASTEQQLLLQIWDCPAVLLSGSAWSSPRDACAMQIACRSRAVMISCFIIHPACVAGVKTAYAQESAAMRRSAAGKRGTVLCRANMPYAVIICILG